MKAAMTSVVSKLRSVVGRRGTLRLVARYDRPSVFDDRSGVARVFLPDMHLLTPNDQAHYRYSFDHDEGVSLFSRALLLADLLRAFDDFDGGDFELHQLGDLADLWRAYDEDGLRALETILRRADYPFLERLLDRALFVAGNHDQELSATHLLHAEKSRLCGSGAKGGILITHGDAVDPVENMGRLNEVAVRLMGESQPSSTYDLRTPAARLHRQAAAYSDDPLAPPPIVNVATAEWSTRYLREWKNTKNAAARTAAWFRDEEVALSAAHEILPLALDAKTRLTDAAGLRYDDVDTAGKYRLRRLGLAASPPDTTVRLMVIGHTHRARIVVAEEQDRENRRRPATGDALILMDCGAWIENATFADEHGRPRTTASAQIGVQCGSDVRIYQCDLGATS